MRTTQHYGLRQPEEADEIRISDLNDNMEILDRELHRQTRRRTITLAASGWSGTYPYSQTVKAAGITAGDSIKIIGLHIPGDATAARVKACSRAAGLLMYSPDGTADGQITFLAYKKPGVDFQIITEGA